MSALEDTDVAHAGDVVFLTFPADMEREDFERARDELKKLVEGRGIQVIALFGVAAAVARPRPRAPEMPELTYAECERFRRMWEMPHSPPTPRWRRWRRARLTQQWQR